MKPGLLITGGAGLLAANWAAAVMDTYAVTLGMHARRIMIDGVDCRIISLESADSIATAIKEASASVVVHAAAMTNVDACEASPTEAHHANVEIARNVARACAACGAKLLHVSTDHVFSGMNSMMDEAEAIGPINVYAQTKASGEVAVLDACPSAIVSRTNFFGWGLPYRKSFSDTVVEALRSGQKIGLFCDAFFTPILMTRLIDASLGLIEADVSGVFHMVGDERLSKYEFGLRIAKAFDLDPDLVRPTRLAERLDLAPRPLDLSLDNRKMCSVIGHDIGDVDSQLVWLREQESDRLQLKAVS